MARVDLDLIESHLEPGESVVWSARPDVGVGAHLRHASQGDLLLALITGVGVFAFVLLLCAGIVGALAAAVLVMTDALAWAGVRPRVQQAAPYAVLVPAIALLIALARSAVAPPSWASARYAATSHGRGIIVHPLGVTLFRLPGPSSRFSCGERRQLEFRLDEPARLVERHLGEDMALPEDYEAYEVHGWTGATLAMTLPDLPDPARAAQELWALQARWHRDEAMGSR